jgi:hypothetical protein
MRNPDSSPELSTHERLIWIEDTAAAERLDGAEGGFGLAASSGSVRNRLKMASHARRRGAIAKAEPKRREWVIEGRGATVFVFILSRSGSCS